MITKIIEQLTAFLWDIGAEPLQNWQIIVTNILGVGLAVMFGYIIIRLILGLFRRII